MATTREIITLQFGHYSNFVGTHWWNLQENTFNYDPQYTTPREVNHDILYREGMTLLGDQTYTPRLVLFDLKSNLKTLKMGGELYEIPSVSENCNWDGAVSKFQAEPEEKNAFLTDLDELASCDDQEVGSVGKMDVDGNDSSSHKVYNLDEEVTVWSDFLKLHFHPKTVLVLDHTQLGDSDRCPMDVFGYGREIYKMPDFFDDLENRLHFFVEECDRLQGFQILVDMNNGYGGLSASVLEDLSDEYGNKTLLTMGLIPGLFTDENDPIKSGERLLNIALSVDRLTAHSSLFVPMSLDSQPWYKSGPTVKFPNLIYQADLDYHTSAVIASAIDTSTLHYRLDSPTNRNMCDLTDMLAQAGRTTASLSLGMPVPTSQDVTLVSLLQNSQNLHSKNVVTSLTPLNNEVGDCFSQSVVVRGIPESHLVSTNLMAAKSSDNEVGRLTSFKSVQEIFLPYLQSSYPRTYSTFIDVKQPCAVKAPFPHIFSPSVRFDGTVIEGSCQDKGTSVAQTSVVTTLQSCSGIGTMLQELLRWVKRINIRKFQSYLESGMEMDDYTQMIENIQSLTQNYECKRS